MYGRKNKPDAARVKQIIKCLVNRGVSPSKAAELVRSNRTNEVNAELIAMHLRESVGK